MQQKWTIPALFIIRYGISLITGPRQPHQRCRLASSVATLPAPHASAFIVTTALPMSAEGVSSLHTIPLIQTDNTIPNHHENLQQESSRSLCLCPAADGFELEYAHTLGCWIVWSALRIYLRHTCILDPDFFLKD